MKFLYRPALTIGCLAVSCLCWFATLAAAADSVENFYRGKTVALFIGAAAGGDTDLAGRLMARHIGKFIPGHPAVVPQNMQGAGSLQMTNYIANAAPRDGLQIGLVVRGVIQQPILGDESAKFDPLKLTWLGTMSSNESDAYLLVVRSERNIHSVEDMRHQTKPVVLGSAGGNSTNMVFAKLSPDIFGFNTKLIMGYPGSTGVMQALRTNEVDGLYSTYTTLTQSGMLKSGAVVPIIQLGRRTRHPDFADVPVDRELVTNQEDQELLDFINSVFFVSLPFVAPYGIPTERAEALRTALMKTCADPAFAADAANLHFDVSPLNGEEVTKIIARMKETPAVVLQRYKQLMAN